MTALTRANLLNPDTGEVNVTVLKGLARREALATFGSTAPRYLRTALRQVADFIPEMRCAWRQRHGLPVDTSNVIPFGPERLGVRRSAF